MSSIQVAEYLSVSGDTVRRWVKSGKLTPIDPLNPLLKRAKAYRFRKADIEALRPDKPPA